MAAPFFDIEESELTSLRDKVILITGCSSGIGLATVKLCLNAGAKVVGGDVNPCPHSSDSLIYARVDVTDWKSQAALFKKAIEAHGRVDHIFANAGMLSQIFGDEADVSCLRTMLTDVGRYRHCGQLRHGCAGLGRRAPTTKPSWVY